MTQNDPKWIILHHAGGSDANPLLDTSNQTFLDIDKYHQYRWNGETKSSLGFYCGYHYVIDRFGTLTQARNDLEGGAHTIGMNYSSIGICLIGNFDLTYPTPEQIKALGSILARLQARYLVPSSRIVPHRQFASKTCFGSLLESVWGAEVLQRNVFADGFVRGIIKKWVELKIIVDPKIALIFGAFNQGPFNKLEAD